MNGAVRLFFLRWGVYSLAVLAATQIVPGLECDSFAGLVVAALLLGLLNAFVRPVLLLLSLPLVILSLGLFLWIINAGLLCLVGWLVKPFHVAGFGSALLGAAVISLVATVASSFLGLNREIGRPRTRPGVPPTSHPRGGQGPDQGQGPVIDV